MILGVIACVVAAFSLGLSLLSFTRLSESVKKETLPTLLSQSAEQLAKDYERRLRLIELEWDNMYQKFAKLVGRADRQRALEPPPPRSVEPDPLPRPLTHSEIMRRYKRQ